MRDSEKILLGVICAFAFFIILLYSRIIFDSLDLVEKIIIENNHKCTCEYCIDTE
jgi:hypothetical protein